MDNRLIFGTIPPRYSKTEWRTFAYAYANCSTYKHKHKDQKDKNVCFSCAYACVVRVLTTVMFMLVFVLTWK